LLSADTQHYNSLASCAMGQQNGIAGMLTWC
jgi:hypothetical protein